MDDARDLAEPQDEIELAVEGALRPLSLAEFVGQQKVRGQLQLLLDAVPVEFQHHGLAISQLSGFLSPLLLCLRHGRNTFSWAS